MNSDNTGTRGDDPRQLADDDNEPIIVGSTDDLDAVLDRLVADSASVEVPPLMQLSRRDTEGWAVLHTGVNGDLGVLTHIDATGSYVTVNREVTGNAEIPLSDVREAARVRHRQRPLTRPLAS